MVEDCIKVIEKQQAELKKKEDDTHRLQELLDFSDAKSVKKDKIIDEMAKYLADIDFDECCAEIPEPCLGCSWEDYEPHVNCIKKYFERKVENG